MTLKTTDLMPRIGSLVEVDAQTLVSGAAGPELRRLMEKRGVIAIRGLDLDDEQQLAFTRSIGPVDERTTGKVYKVSLQKSEQPEYYQFNYGNFSWHIDRTDQDVPPFSSILNAKRLSPHGGQTEFANTYAAYDDLPESDKELIENLYVVHNVTASQLPKVPNPTQEQLALWARVPDNTLPLVWRHRNGRRSLVTSTSGAKILGMEEAEGKALLKRLMEWATQPQYVYVHEWKLGDIVMWDNTGTMHKVRDYDLDSGRLLHRTTVLGDEAFEPEIFEQARKSQKVH